MGDRKLRYRSARCRRRVADRDSVFPRIGDINVIHPDAAPDDQLQFSGLKRRINHRLAHLRGRPDDQNIEFLHLFLQFLNLIELLHHLITGLFQRRRGSFIHSVRCQYTYHILILLSSLFIPGSEGSFSYSSGKS